MDRTLYVRARSFLCFGGVLLFVVWFDFGFDFDLMSFSPFLLLSFFFFFFFLVYLPVYAVCEIEEFIPAPVY